MENQNYYLRIISLLIILIYQIQNTFQQVDTAYEVLTCLHDANTLQKSKLELCKTQEYCLNYQCYNLESMQQHEECRYIQEGAYIKVKTNFDRGYKVTPQEIQDGINHYFDFLSEDSRLVYEKYMGEYKAIYLSQPDGEEEFLMKQIQLSMYSKRFMNWIYELSVGTMIKKEYIKNSVQCLQECLREFDQDMTLYNEYFQNQIHCYKLQYGGDQWDVSSKENYLEKEENNSNVFVPNDQNKKEQIGIQIQDVDFLKDETSMSEILYYNIQVVVILFAFVIGSI